MWRTLWLLAALLWTAGTGVPVWAAPAPDIDTEAIKEFVRWANSDEVYGQAYRTGDPALLRQAWAGEALLDMEDDLASLRTMRQYLDLALEDMEFQRVEELGPGRVRAVTLERWLARLYQLDGTYLGYQRQIVENRYLLEQRGDRWYIIEADQEIHGGDPVFRPGEPQ